MTPSPAGGTISATTPGEPTATVDDADNVARLRALAKTQTRDEIDAIVASGENFYSLLGDADPATGRSTLVAAFPVPKSAFNLLAISVPG